jgi:inorganic pyrophosphatase
MGIARLTPFYEQTTMANVVIETPRGMPVKLKYDEKNDVFRVHKGMPVGFEFPFNFGFVPRTVGGDGDPLDVLVLSSHVMPAGTVVVGRIVSVLEAEQVEGKKKERNDRLIVTPWDLISRSPMLPKLYFDKRLKHAIIEFFTKYNEAQGKRFRPLRFAPAQRGIQLTREAVEAHSAQELKGSETDNSNGASAPRVRSAR